MTRWGLLLALAGLAVGVWLIAMQDLDAMGALLGAAGLGLLLLVPAHLPATLANAWAWALLMPRHQRPGVLAMLELIWIRDSINALLPVGRVGGELACYRLLRRQGVGSGAAAGGLLMDMGLSVVSQLVFALLGLGLLLARGQEVGWPVILGVTLGGILLAAPFIAVQNARMFGRFCGWLNRVSAGRIAGLAEESRRIDTFLRRAWRLPKLLLWCFIWQLLAWMLGAVQIWVALWLMGAPISFVDALIIEALVQAVLSLGFVVPGGLGVMEAGFLGVGALLGLDPATSVALALTRRFREVVMYLPGLVVWALAERRLGRDGLRGGCQER